MIQPIETRYAGYRFRSRLEARWAVFFDQLGIRWEYEPQGYVVGREPGTAYLPDFWLPEIGIWAEVKGAEESLDIVLLAESAIPHSGLPKTLLTGPGGHDSRMLILGPVPRAGLLLDLRDGDTPMWTQPTHAVLTFYKGDVFQGQAWFRGRELVVETVDGCIANDSGEIFWGTRGIEWGNLTGSGAAIGGSPEWDVAGAYKAARSARFEHGEQG